MDFVQSSLVGRRIKFHADAPCAYIGGAPLAPIDCAGRTATILAVGIGQNGGYMACIEFNDKAQLTSLFLGGTRHFDWLDFRDPERRHQNLVALRDALVKAEPLICRYVCGDPGHSPLCREIQWALDRTKESL